MILPDVNVLVYAHREEAADHERYRAWLQSIVNSDTAFAMADLVLSGFVRIVTHPRIFREPTASEVAVEIANDLRSRGNCVSVRPGPRHWAIFARLCSETGARGNVVPDAYLAALAIENGCEWVTTDRHFGRFKGLRRRHPLH